MWIHSTAWRWVRKEPASCIISACYHQTVHVSITSVFHSAWQRKTVNANNCVVWHSKKVFSSHWRHKRLLQRCNVAWNSVEHKLADNLKFKVSNIIWLHAAAVMSPTVTQDVNAAMTAAAANPLRVALHWHRFFKSKLLLPSNYFRASSSGKLNIAASAHSCSNRFSASGFQVHKYARA